MSKAGSVATGTTSATGCPAADRADSRTIRSAPGPDSCDVDLSVYICQLCQF
jgi:hypothetical protein